MADYGSNLKITIPSSNTDHTTLSNRDLPKQHPIDSIYRREDDKPLDEVLTEIQDGESEVLHELVIVTTDGQTVITLTTFEYNMARDVLFVTLEGLQVNEGPEEDYVMTAPTQITFNYELTTGQEVYIAIAGTKGNTGFGGDIHTSLNQFKQLVDVPSSYYSKGGLFVKVNPEETGLVFGVPVVTHSRQKVEIIKTLTSMQSVEEYLNFVEQCNIKTIRVTPVDVNGDPVAYTGSFFLDVWDLENGYWIYSSGEITTVLYDYMDIIHIDASESNVIYYKLNNEGPSSIFKVEIFFEI